MGKFTSVRKKIMMLVLAVSLIGFGALSISSILSLITIRNSTADASRGLGTTASDLSSQSMEEQVKATLLATAKGAAAQTDEQLKVIENQTEMIANEAAYIYSHPEKYTKAESEVDYLKEDQVGEFTLHIKTAEGVTKESIQDELNLISNISPLLCQVNELDLNINASYIGSPSGFQLSADKDPQGPNNQSFPVTERGWYKGAVEADGFYWTDVFVDASANRISINCSMPYYDEQDTLRGVAVSAATLDEIKSIVTNTKVGNTGYSFVLDNDGNIIITDQKMQVQDDSVIYDNLFEQTDEGIREACADMKAKKSDIHEGILDGKAVYLAYTPLTIMPWTMVTVIEKSEVQEPGEEIASQISTNTNQTVAAINHQIRVTLFLFAVILVIILAVIIIMSQRFSMKLTDPIKELTQHVRQISSGDLDIRIEPSHTGDEVEILGNAFSQMTIDLRTYIENIQTITAEKERIGAELNVATQIQASMLPCIFPAFPEYKEFEVFATMEPAKEVGGDFYDFFLVDKDHVAVVIADVSGKGVPAALFMVIAKTLIKNHAQNGETPEEIFTNVNEQLCENNDAGMFVTAWMGIMEINTGHFVYVNAGHNPPLLKRADGSFEYMKCRAGFVLAGMEGIRYRQGEMELNGGDILYLYTDGVTEATDRNDQMYGEERLQMALNTQSNETVENILHHVRSDIQDFVKEAEQFDDITMVVLKIHAKEGEYDKDDSTGEN